MVPSRRRTLLATIGSVAVAGCLNTDSDDSSGSDDQTPDTTQSQTASATTPADPETPDQTPTTATETPAATETDTPAETPNSDTPESGGGSETPDQKTPTPADGDELFPGYEMTDVVVESAESSVLGEVRAAIADTGQKQYTGLSDTESLPEQYGMLFVYETVERRTFVMRRMDFGIDIIYADGEGTITTIHHAEEPAPDEDGNEQRYPGEGQYVLEVNYDWTTDRGVTVGDTLSDLP